MSDEVVNEEAASEELGSGRRDLFGKAAMAAAVAAAVGLSRSSVASAANGDVMNVGALETGSATTALSGGTTFRVTDGSSTGITGGVNPRDGSIYGRNSLSGHAGILGEATGTSGGWAVYGRNSSSQGRGVYGLNVASGGVGVYGEHRAGSTESGTGVFGVSNAGTGVSGSSTSGTGVSAVSSSGLGLRASGTTFDITADGSGRIALTKAGFAAPPSGASTIGTLARDSEGNLWYSPASGVYRKLAGSGTAGAFHAISPSRVYDSRVAEPAGNVGLVTNGSNRLVSVASQRDLTTGAVTTANIIPAGATAVTANVTVADTQGFGFLAINPGGDTEVKAAAINWAGNGLILNNGLNLTLNSSREVTIVCGGGGNTHVIIDVTGYFL
jgi:hypothetical protein